MTDLPAESGLDIDLDAFDLGKHYAVSRERLTTLVTGLIAESLDMSAIPVPACPSWSVHDVLADLTAVVEDVMSGRIKGPPSSEVTSEQVERRRGMPTAEMLEEWTKTAPPFESALNSVRAWPGFLDVLAHEHDIRGAVDRPAGREDIGIIASASWLLRFWKPPVPLELIVRTGDTERVLRQSGAELTLTTTDFEVFRFRLGRRSLAQLRAMDWIGDPTPVLEQMVIFGPEPYDVVE